MTIVSISLNDKILDDIDQIQNEFGFTGRSEVIRAGARLLIAEKKDIDQLEGNINSVLLLIHNQESEHVVSEIKHKFEDITKTQIHSHLHKNKCLELFILEGNVKSIKSMVRYFQVSGKMHYIKLIIA
jgi:CopG family nickel-responsive transcriptional regulator